MNKAWNGAWGGNGIGVILEYSFLVSCIFCLEQSGQAVGFLSAAYLICQLTDYRSQKGGHAADGGRVRLWQNGIT